MKDTLGLRYGICEAWHIPGTSSLLRSLTILYNMFVFLFKDSKLYGSVITICLDWKGNKTFIRKTWEWAGGIHREVWEREMSFGSFKQASGNSNCLVDIWCLWWARIRINNGRSRAHCYSLFCLLYSSFHCPSFFCPLVHCSLILILPWTRMPTTEPSLQVISKLYIAKNKCFNWTCVFFLNPPCIYATSVKPDYSASAFVK